MRLRTALTTLATILVAACATTVPSPEPQPGAGHAIAQVATALVGTPYHFGGADLQGFDCSGLVVYSHERVGLEVPRTAAEQSRLARPVALEALSPGDLVFFRLRGRRVNHVGIYAGSGRFIHAPRSGGVVSYADLADPYYRKHLAGAGRFWRADVAETADPSPH